MIDTLTLDENVQTTLRDKRDSAADRAVQATIMIEMAVREEFGLHTDEPLAVPPQWRHRVPLTDADVRRDTEVVEMRLMDGSVLHLDNTQEVQTLNPSDDLSPEATAMLESLIKDVQEYEPTEEEVAAANAIDFWGDDEPTDKPSFWQRFRSRMRESR